MKMYISRIVFFLFIALTSLPVIGQNKLIVGINPLAPIDFTIIPRVEIFGEYFLHPKQSMVLDIGMGNFGNERDTHMVPKFGFRTALTFKQYHVFYSAPRCYMGMQLFFWYEQSNGTFSGYKADKTTYFRDGFGIYRSNLGVNLIIGYMLNIDSWPFVADFYGGLGIRNVQIENINRTYDPSDGDASSYKDRGMFYYRRVYTEDSGTGLTATFGVRVGRIFHKKKGEIP